MNKETRTFTPGKKYQVRKNFSSGSTFEAGEILIFDRDLFSWYDEAQVYSFHRLSDNVVKNWVIDDEALRSSSQEYFEPLDDDED